ncbi:Ig-like domain-containing protein [Conexibacter woesei]|uniref:Ig-like domain-containing protein n=1 Tax=Conexibacter woesei TaxID=191495 RepID=UPI00041BA128|nr:Ig-like domain-containing protein [Conexibacter woesei]
MIRTIHKLSTAAAAVAALSALAAAPAAQADQHWQALTGIPIHGTPVVAISETQAITVAADQTRYEGGGVLVTTRSPDGSWSAPVHLGSSSDAWNVDVATNARGDVVVGWDDGTQHIAVRPAGQGFLPTVDLPDSVESENINGPSPQVGVNDAGEVTTAWSARADANDNQLPNPDAVRYTTGSLTAPVQTVHTSADASTGRAFELRTAHQGPSALVWSGDLGVSAVLRRAGEDFGAVQQITPAGIAYTGPAVGGPVIAVRPDGRAAVAFEGSDDGSDPNRVELSRSDANGTFEPAAYVTPAGQDTQRPALAWPAGSDIQVAWLGSAASRDEAVTAVAPADGPLGVLPEHAYDNALDGSQTIAPHEGVQVLSAAGGTMTLFQRRDDGLRSVNWKLNDPTAQPAEYAIDPQPAAENRVTAASDDAGDVAVGWNTKETPWLPALSVWDATPPAVTVTAPATVTAGRPFLLTVGATDALSGVASRAVTFANALGQPVAGPLVGADGTATATLGQPGTYALTGRAADAGDNAATATRTITVVAAPRTPVVVKSTCRVPSLRNHSVAYARRLLTVWHCRLGRVTTPRRYKHVKGLVIRGQSRPAGQKPVVGAHVNVTLGVRPKPKARHHKSHKKSR